MPVASVQDEVVLEDQRRDPQVVNGNRPTLTAKVAEERGVMVGRLLVCEERRHARLGEEHAQDALVLRPSPAQREAGPQLGHDHEGDKDSFGVPTSSTARASPRHRSV